MFPFAMKIRFGRCSSIPMYSYFLIHPSISMQYRFFWSKDNNQKDTTGPFGAILFKSGSLRRDGKTLLYKYYHDSTNSIKGS